MEAIVGLLLFVFAVSWFALAVSIFMRSGPLCLAFLRRYPDEARARMRHLDDGLRDPSHILYFLSARSRRFLEERKDDELLRERMFVVRSIWTFAGMNLGPAAIGLTLVFLA
jgi:hypothetical protein